MRAPSLAVLTLALATLACHQSDKADALKSMPLVQWNPRSKLHLPQTPIKRLQFAAIDFHQHLALPGNKNFVTPAELVKVMDAHNVAAMVHLTGGGDQLQAVLKTFVKPYPGRFVVFTELDWHQLRHANFGERMALDVRQAVKQGSRGLKLLKWFGLGARHPDGKLVRIDDPGFDPVWKVCGELGIPVAIHSGDPEAFFDPVDANNERFEELLAHPQWSFHDARWPRLPELLAARDRVFARHPQTTFVALHVGGWPENLDYVSQMLKQHAHVFVDLGARQAELGRQPRRARAFMLEHQDRIVFGTDETPAPWNDNGAQVYQSYGRFLETDDEAFDYYGSPGQGRWTISGLALPPEVLQKIYRDNAMRILHME